MSLHFTPSPALVQERIEKRRKFIRRDRGREGHRGRRDLSSLSHPLRRGEIPLGGSAAQGGKAAVKSVAERRVKSPPAVKLPSAQSPWTSASSVHGVPGRAVKSVLRTGYGRKKTPSASFFVCLTPSFFREKRKRKKLCGEITKSARSGSNQGFP